MRRIYCTKSRRPSLSHSACVCIRRYVPYMSTLIYAPAPHNMRILSIHTAAVRKRTRTRISAQTTTGRQPNSFGYNSLPGESLSLSLSSDATVWRSACSCFVMRYAQIYCIKYLFVPGPTDDGVYCGAYANRTCALAQCWH